MTSLPFAALATAALAAATALSACDTAEAPLAPGTFELTVTGDVAAKASGSAYVARPDSGLNVTTGVWTAHIPIVFNTDREGGDPASVRFTVVEPREPNGSFTELPEGTFVVTEAGGDPREPVVLLVVYADGLGVGGHDGTLRLRRTADGVEGELRARYTEVTFSNKRFEGHIDLRFHALPAPPGAARP